MSIRTFGIGAAAVLALLLIYIGYRLTHLWEYERLGTYAVRRNTLTGIVELGDASGNYTPSSTNDQYADPVSDADLKRVHIIDPAWDSAGVLAAQAVVAPPADKPIRGRLAVRIQVLDIKLHKRLRDRSLRATVNWPGGATTPFVLRTNLEPPHPEQNEKAFVTVVPTLYSGEGDASGGKL